MTSFGYRLNPRYAIKECSSCGSLYTRNCSCSKGSVEDKILVPKPPKNCARCARCGHPFNGPYCQGCALLREKLEEDLVTYFQKFQNTYESSDGSTNIVNAPREPFVVKQDHGVNHPHIDECCCECGEALDGIICQRCTCKSYGKCAHIGYNFPPKVPIISNREPCNQTINNEPPPSWNRPAVYDDDDDDVDYTIAITPVLSTEEPYNSLSMGNEHLDTILATESDEVITYSVEDLVLILSESEEVEKIVIPEDEEIENDNLLEKLLKVNLLIAEIEALKDNPTPSSNFLTKSSSTSPKPFLEETNTFHNSLPEFENFCFELEEISSGSTTTHSVISLPVYEAFSFYDDHIKEIHSGSTTTQFDISLPEYDSFIFNLSNDQFPPADRSDFTQEEFDDEPLTSYLHQIADDYSPLLAYVVWIFLSYLTYPAIPPHLHSFGNKDTIFDPNITINRSYSFKPGLSHRCGTFEEIQYPP
nr:hypothetical protein [Tanacetum cinerariifolium]